MEVTPSEISRGEIAQPRSSGRKPTFLGVSFVVMLIALLGLGGFIGFRIWYTMRMARLFNAVGAGDVASVEKLLADGMNPNQQDTRSAQTILMYAAQFGRSEVVRTLLKHGASPNLAYKGRRGTGDYFDGRTALMYATEATANSPATTTGTAGNQPTVLQLLIEAGADVNARDVRGQSALTIAIERAQSGAAIFLIEHGANPNVPNDFGEPILIAAIETSQFQPALAMIEKGADVNLTDRELKKVRPNVPIMGRPPTRSAPGETALIAAVKINNPQVVEALIRHGARLEAVDAKGQAASNYVSDKTPEIRKLLEAEREKAK